MGAVKKNVIAYLWITLASAIYAVGFNWCYEPNQIGFGGITGVGQIINHFIPGIPIGTAVMASSGGTVTRAGWGSGYGYVVYIQHADGRETRYGHLSKVLVSVGQKVSQGQKIALSGNTGRSTGPHLHFEIRINGQAVNPLNYLN